MNAEQGRVIGCGRPRETAGRLIFDNCAAVNKKPLHSFAVFVQGGKCGSDFLTGSSLAQMFERDAASS